MDKSKLIMLNGAAAVGKTTIANLYANKFPRTLNFAGDVLIEMISHWRGDEEKVRRNVFLMTLSAAQSYLESGNDVLLQYLLTDPADAQAFAECASAAGADFYEVLLEVDKETAVRRLLKRGVWGEENSPQLTEADIPEIESLYDRMTTATDGRPNTVSVPVIEGDIDSTFQTVLQVVGR